MLPTPSSPASVTPSDDEIVLARESGSRVSRMLQRSVELRVQPAGRGQDDSVPIPPAAARLLGEILIQMGRGNTVALLTTQGELTTQQAADILSVSRPYLIKLLEEGKLPFRKVGKHRRILLGDLVALKQKIDNERDSALRRLAEEGQELDMGY